MKCTLMFTVETHRGETIITSDQLHAERSGKIKRIFRSKRHSIPRLVVCRVPKGTAPWEISSELEPIELECNGEYMGHAAYQLTDMGEVGRMLLAAFARGIGWDSQIVIVPESFVPKQEKSFDAGTADAGAEAE